ncbi:hypothetical protein [Shinella sp.]|uniref:hypothetical protein n=1 Tax=Shinella sp. TaxID=1870904 RepID=UPI0028AE59BA|nr:hypothetical protein [Shinella sp.]
MKSVITFFAAVMIAATPALGKSSAPVYKPEIWEFNGLAELIALTAVRIALLSTDLAPLN